MNRDSHCVFETGDPHLADVIVAWLEGEGVHARVMDLRTMGTVFGSWLHSTGAADRLEIWVADPQDQNRASALLAEHAAQHAAAQAPDAAETFDAACDECGAVSAYPAQSRGTVQTCPICERFTDLPGATPEFEFPQVEFPEEEESRD